MDIRKATALDANAMTALAMQSKQSNGYDDDFMAACADELRVTPALLDAHDYWVACGDDLCGMVCLQIDNATNTGKVGAFFIHSDWQRRGVGRQLWATLKADALAHRLTSLTLDSDPGAESFYKSLGFTTINRVPSGSIKGRTLPHMRIEFYET